MISGRGYEIGTKVQQKQGTIRVKVGNSNWMAESRYNWIMQKGPIEEGQRVFHLNGKVDDNRLNNLVKIQFNTKKFVILKTSRVLYTPKTRVESERIFKQFVPQEKEKELAKAA